MYRRFKGQFDNDCSTAGRSTRSDGFTAEISYDSPAQFVLVRVPVSQSIDCINMDLAKVGTTHPDV